MNATSGTSTNAVAIISFSTNPRIRSYCSRAARRLSQGSSIRPWA